MSAVVLCLVLVIGVAAVPCGGDGGAPFAAEASAQGRTCAFLDDTWQPLLAAIGLVAWRSSSSRWRTGFGPHSGGAGQ